jgi:hypothetical protein
MSIAIQYSAPTTIPTPSCAVDRYPFCEFRAGIRTDTGKSAGIQGCCDDDVIGIAAARKKFSNPEGVKTLRRRDMDVFGIDSSKFTAAERDAVVRAFL